MNQKINVNDLALALTTIAKDLKKQLESENLTISDDTAVQVAIRIIDGMNLQGSYLPALLQAISQRTSNGILKI